jgi:bifunctional N-acetylglucosamine-1-phosphate-uridyltransferase/glucosamine-1-phosphate-acetyltransferase GlmU-like protein
MSRPTLAIVLVDDLPATEAPSLCGRPALEWLLDTVEELAPAMLVTNGAVGVVARDRASLASALRIGELQAHDAGRGGARRTVAQCEVTVVLPASAPLLRPHTLRQILDSLGPGGRATGVAAVVELTRPAPWWAEAPDAGPPGGPMLLAVAGSIGLSAAELADAAAAGDVAGVCARLPTGVRVRTLTLSGVESLSVNEPTSRLAAERALYARIAADWLDRGVIIEDPASTRIDASVTIGAGARIRPNTHIAGDSHIGRGSTVGPTTTVVDSRVGQDCLVHYSVCTDVEIGDGANVGPFTWLRSGTSLGAGCRAGAFVEVADSVVGEGTAVPHLAGLFSADVGRDCNIASMAGSLNYNGGVKRRTRIGDEVSIGSGSILIAPVSVGDRAETAAGSVITEDVPEGALGLARAPQRNVAGWDRLRGRGAAV